MTPELPSIFAADYESPAWLSEHSSTSAFDPDRISWRPNAVSIFPCRHAWESTDVFPYGNPIEYGNPLTNDLVILTSTWDLFMTEVADRTRQGLAIRQAYRNRIESLRSDAAVDGFLINQASERDFWSFMKSLPFAHKADVVLVNNGNLRAIWDSEDGTHLGLQFLGNRALQYVIFRRRQGSSAISRVAGRDTFEGVTQQVQAFGLKPLLQT